MYNNVTAAPLRKKKRKVSFTDFLLFGGVPGAVLLFRPILSLLTTRQRDPSMYDVVDPSAMIQIGYIFIAFAVAVYFFSRSSFNRYLLQKSPLRYLALYSIVASLSAFWSINPMISLYRGFECLAMLALVASVYTHLASRLRWEAIIDWTLFYALWVIGLSMVRRFDYLGFSFDLIIAEQFNTTMFFFFALLLARRSIMKWIIIPLSVLSQSNTAYFGMATGLLGFKEGNEKLKLVLIALSIVVVVSVFTFGGETVLKATLFHGKEGVGMEYTTGRDRIIEEAIPYILASPVIGHGFVAPEIELVVDYHTRIIGVHNVVLASLLGMGAIGLIIISLFFFELFKTARSKIFKPEYRAAFTGSAIMILFHALANPGIGSRVYGTWLPAVILCTAISSIYILHIIELKYHENNLDNKKFR